MHSDIKKSSCVAAGIIVIVGFLCSAIFSGHLVAMERVGVVEVRPAGQEATEPGKKPQTATRSAEEIERGRQESMQKSHELITELRELMERSAREKEEFERRMKQLEAKAKRDIEMSRAQERAKREAQEESLRKKAAAEGREIEEALKWLEGERVKAEREGEERAAQELAKREKELEAQRKALEDLAAKEKAKKDSEAAQKKAADDALVKAAASADGVREQLKKIGTAGFALDDVKWFLSLVVASRNIEAVTEALSGITRHLNENKLAWGYQQAMIEKVPVLFKVLGSQRAVAPEVVGNVLSVMGNINAELGRTGLSNARTVLLESQMALFKQLDYRMIETLAGKNFIGLMRDFLLLTKSDAHYPSYREDIFNRLQTEFSAIAAYQSVVQQESPIGRFYRDLKKLQLGMVREDLAAIVGARDAVKIKALYDKFAKARSGLILDQEGQDTVTLVFDLATDFLGKLAQITYTGTGGIRYGLTPQDTLKLIEDLFTPEMIAGASNQSLKRLRPVLDLIRANPAFGKELLDATLSLLTTSLNGLVRSIDKKLNNRWAITQWLLDLVDLISSAMTTPSIAGQLKKIKVILSGIPQNSDVPVSQELRDNVAKLTTVIVRTTPGVTEVSYVDIS